MSHTTQTPPDPLDPLVGPDGRVRFGVSHRPLRRVDLGAARFAWHGVPLPAAARRFRLKEWQHVCVVSRDWLLTFAIVDTKFLRVAWLQGVDLRAAARTATAGTARFEHHRRSPLLDLRVGDALWDDKTHVHARGLRIDVHNHLDAGCHTLDLDVAASRGLPAVKGSLVLDHDLATVAPMVVSLPVGPGRTMYSHKVPLPVRGELQIGDETVVLDRASGAVALLDIHKAHYPRHTWWRWATCGGYDAEGRLLGLNLTRNVVEDDARYNENALWVDGRVTRLGPARFTLDRADPHPPWIVGTADGAAALAFTPLGGRREDLDVPGVLRSRFNQLYGRFDGTVETADAKIRIDGLVGLCEDHDSLW